MRMDVKPIAKTGMLIRRSAREVFEAFVNPAVTAEFWFTKSSGRLESGKTIRWEWEMYGISEEIKVTPIPWADSISCLPD